MANATADLDGDVAVCYNIIKETVMRLHVIHIWELLKVWLWSRQPRRKLTITIIRKGTEMVCLYEVNLPVPEGDDPGRVSWVLTPTFNNIPQSPITGPIDVLKTDLRVPAMPGGGSPRVDLLLAHVDAAGNVSEASSFSFAEPDNIPPVQPGQVSIVFLGTEADPVV